MKIAIMTWFHYDNYGTVLQAAALTRVLRNMGHEADVIRYFPKEQVYRMPKRTERREQLRQLSRQRREEKNPVIVSALAGEAFNLFRDRYLTLTDYYATLTDLESLNGKYDAFICGSDLIWLPRYFDPHYYLDFVRDTDCMIAYAPSLLDDGGTDSSVLEQMGRLIRRFRHLSVREESGRRILDSFFEIHAEEVADPVLLMSAREWDKLLAEEFPVLAEAGAEQDRGERKETGSAKADSAKTDSAKISGEEVSGAETGSAETGGADRNEAAPGDGPERAEETAEQKEPAEEASAEEAASAKEAASAEEEASAKEAAQDGRKGYLFASFQGIHPTYWDAVDKLASRLELEVRIVPVHLKDESREGCVRESVSPLRYVELIRGAAYVCTDCYHAVALALLFGREVCCFERYTERTQLGRNARIRHILDVVGLSSRLYDSEAPLENYLKKIDWIPVNYKMDALRMKSEQYLAGALGEVEEHNRTRTWPRPHVLEGFSLCCGCGACAAVCAQGAVTVEPDGSGFYRARVDEERCVRCGRCTQVCPLREDLEGGKIAAGRLLSYTDEEQEMAFSAASGGLASRLALVLHRRGAAVAGCVYDEADQRAKHILVLPTQSEDALKAMRGNKYLQSDFQGLWAELEEYAGPAAIFGTPCQIAAARRVLAGRDNIVYIDLVCGGVPSAPLYQKYREAVARKRRWLRGPGADSFERILSLNECHMDTCYECRWRDTGAADLRIGDLRTDFAGRRGEREGSIVICLTERGTGLLNELMLSGYWEGLKKEDLAAYIASHPARNPIKPVFYEELAHRIADEHVSMKRLLGDYVKPLEKRYVRKEQAGMFYEVGRKTGEAQHSPEEERNSPAIPGPLQQGGDVLVDQEGQHHIDHALDEGEGQVKD